MISFDLAAPFVLGLIGSLHCAQMCGPVVLAYSLPIGGLRFGQQMSAHAGYNAGRIATYGVLGAAAGVAGTAVGGLGRFAGVASAAAIVAGVLLIASGATIAGWSATQRVVRVGRPGAAAWLARLGARWLQSPGAARKLALGLVLGMLPCGLVYAALLQALATGSALRGAASMVAFGVGTAPALFGVGLACTRLAPARAWWGPRLTGASVAFLGVLLLWRALMAAPPGHACP